MSQTSNAARHPMFALTLGSLVLACTWIVGCARSPRDYLSNLSRLRARSESPADEQQPQKDNSSLIAQADAEVSPGANPIRRVSLFGGRSEEEPKERGRLFRTLVQRHPDQNARSEDPFLAAADVSDAEASEGQDAPRLSSDEMFDLLSGRAVKEAKQPQQPPWWQKHVEGEADESLSSLLTRRNQHDENPSTRVAQTFSADFEQRLESLRADLTTTRERPRAETSYSESPTVAAAEESHVESANPFAVTKTDFTPANRFAAEKSDVDADNPFAAGTAATAPDHPIEPQPPVESGRSHPLADSASEEETPACDARQKVDVLMAEARHAWETWQLQEAHCKALDAHELALAEGVSFGAGEERPSDLVKLISEEIRNEAALADSSRPNKTKLVMDSWPEDASSLTEALPSVFPKDLASPGWQPIPDGESLAVTNESSCRAVNLLPPHEEPQPSDVRANRSVRLVEHETTVDPLPSQDVTMQSPATLEWQSAEESEEVRWSMAANRDRLFNRAAATAEPVDDADTEPQSRTTRPIRVAPPPPLHGDESVSDLDPKRDGQGPEERTGWLPPGGWLVILLLGGLLVIRFSSHRWRGMH